MSRGSVFVWAQQPLKVKKPSQLQCEAFGAARHLELYLLPCPAKTGVTSFQRDATLRGASSSREVKTGLKIIVLVHSTNEQVTTTSLDRVLGTYKLLNITSFHSVCKRPRFTLQKQHEVGAHKRALHVSHGGRARPLPHQNTLHHFASSSPRRLCTLTIIYAKPFAICSVSACACVVA